MTRGRRLTAIGLLALGALGTPGVTGAGAAEVDGPAWAQSDPAERGDATVQAAGDAPAPGGDEVHAAQSTANGDPAGDTDPTNECRADILAFGVDYTPQAVSLFTDVRCGSNPHSDPSWVTGISYALWALDTDADDAHEWEVALFNDGSQLTANLYHVDTNFVHACSVVPSWDGGGRFGVLLSASCIGHPTSLRAGAVMVWDENPFGNTCTCPSDFAPNAAPYWGTRVEPTFHPLPLGDGPGAAATGGGEIDVFARGQDNALWTRHFDGVNWGGWQSLGGIIVGTPAAVSIAEGQVDVFVRGQDNALWTQHFNGTAWSGWVSRGGILSAPPGVTTPAAGVVQVFVAGHDRALYSQRFVGASGSGWQNLGGVIIGTPSAASRNPEQIELFVRGQDDRLYRQVLQGGSWSGWQQIPGLFISSSPGAVALDTVDSRAYVRGHDGALWTIDFQNLQAGTWVSEGGILHSSPAAVMQGSEPVIFARGQDSALWQRTQGHWSSLGGVIL